MLPDFDAGGREDLLGRIETAGRVRVAIVDPGTNMAVRYVEYLRSPAGEITQGAVAQEFFCGRTAGGNCVERVAALGARLRDSQWFWGADVYLLEKQFENNVVFSVGVVAGMIGAMRPAGLRQKRSGALAATELPYMVYGMGCHYKGEVLRRYAPGLPEDIKKRAVAAAQIICQGSGDLGTLEILSGPTLAHDVADTVCYGEGILWHLRSPLGTSGRGNRNKRKP